MSVVSILLYVHACSVLPASQTPAIPRSNALIAIVLGSMLTFWNRSEVYDGTDSSRINGAFPS